MRPALVISRAGGPRLDPKGLITWDLDRPPDLASVRWARPTGSGAVAESQGRDYAGAIYGSLLAGSVVAGTSPGREAPAPWQLATLLVATGMVFWLAHVYAHLFGGAHRHDEIGWRTIRRVGSREWPIAAAVLPPSAAALAGMVLGLADSTTAWVALGVAVAGQVAWAIAGATAAGAERRVVALSALVNLALGLTLVALKAVVAH